MTTSTVLKSKSGFTLVEVLIALAISGIVMAALSQTFISQQKSYLLHEEISTMQQSVRGAMILLTNDIRMAGYDSLLTGNFGIVSISPRDVNNNNNIDIGLTGNSCIQVTEDLDDNGLISAGETIRYTVYDFIPTDNNLDLGRDSGGGNQILAENIQKFGLAFAFDDDFNGEFDTYTALNPGGTRHIIWAVDSDGDDVLDTNLDTNLDGVIDINDSVGGMGSNGIIPGTPLPSNVPMASIRAVRIWVLAETDKADTGISAGNATYVVGKYVVTPNIPKRMRLLTSTVRCRNLGI